MTFGPTLPISQETHARKYRSEGESFEQCMYRVADALADNENHFRSTLDILNNMRFLPGGRIQAAMGSPKQVTAFNCFVMDTMPDSMKGIIRILGEAAETMRRGGGVGYDFSTLRPENDLIRTLNTYSSGPISFANIFDAMCSTIASAGHRRGAMMMVLRVDHPDIEKFVHAKQNGDKLTQFNISVAVTDEFMEAVESDGTFNLKFNGRVYRTIKARPLWNEIMRSTWDWAEPGVLFIDTINRMNNLWYCEDIAAVNPCAEQPLPPYGACLLGSFNLTKYVYKTDLFHYAFNYEQFCKDIPHVVRAMDNVIDRTIYPLAEQELEAVNKRRMGLGVTGVANAMEIMNMPYGSPEALQWLHHVLKLMNNECYRASANLALEKGAFPMYDPVRYPNGQFIQRLDREVQYLIRQFGIRNSHLTSIAPTGTISLSADNISSGIEPVFSHKFTRTIREDAKGHRTEEVTDYAYREFGVNGKTAGECSADDHLNTLLVASRWVDSAVSKTCNVSPDMPWEDFKDIYMRAWKGGAKGCTTFNPGGKRYGILNTVEENEGAACFVDPETGKRTCE